MLTLCIEECLLGKDHVNAPMIPCGLCERWFHLECLGLPKGSQAHCIRGLYFCQHCLTDLRELRRLARPQRHLEARVQAMEATQEALDAENALLRKVVVRHCPGVVLDDDLVGRAGGDQLVSSTFAALLSPERAELERIWTEVISDNQRESGRRASDAVSAASESRKRAASGPVSDVVRDRKSRRYECHLCSFWSPRWGNLCAHLKEQHDRRIVYNCTVCRKQFLLSQRFQKHRDATAGCRKASFSKTFIRYGSEGDAAAVPAAAPLGGTGKSSQPFAPAHQKPNRASVEAAGTGSAAAAVPYECTVCDKTFWSSYGFRAHKGACSKKTRM
jgi:hypothetical protein